MSTANRIVGTKGSDVYASTGDPRLDLSVKCVRGADASVIRAGLRAVLALRTQQALEDAAVLTFHVRNVRGGRGERDLFAALFTELHAAQPKIARVCAELIPHYGSWRDVFELEEEAHTAGNKVLAAELQYIACAQLRADVATEATKGISLAAKWAPREGGASDAQAKRFATAMSTESHFSSRLKSWRKLVAGLNKRMTTVETKMCAGEWDTIKPATVPGRAGKLYARAFLNLESTFGKDEKKPRPRGEVLRHPDDAVRMACRETFKEHYAAAARGEKKVRGAETLFPHELVKAARGLMFDVEKEAQNEDEKNHLRAVWREMVAKFGAADGLKNTIFMCDFSGSMQSSTAGDTPYWVSMALGMLGSQIARGEFKNKIMTFDSTPRWHTFPESADLFGLMETIRGSIGQGLSTDFQKAMDLVLQTLKTNRVKPEDVPENLVVLTDMNWDQACASADRSVYTGSSYRHAVKTETWQTHIEMIREAFKRAGEDMWGVPFVPPRIVVWNLAASPQTDYHAMADTPGVAMLAGWSPAQFAVLQKEGPRQLTAYEILRMELDDKQYDRVRDVVRTAVGPATAEAGGLVTAEAPKPPSLWADAVRGVETSADMRRDWGI